MLQDVALHRTDRAIRQSLSHDAALPAMVPGRDGREYAGGFEEMAEDAVVARLLYVRFSIVYCL